ncbi:MAG: 4Fe-4S binding protein [Candidatus Cloacimonetes bacterium]|nr:4Fe-4S binding protein [Candidatus Cloacimonadota bacterium]
MRKFGLRFFIQLFFFLVGATAFVLLATGVVSRAAHALCPFSAVCFGVFGLHPATPGGFFPHFSIGAFVVSMELIGLLIAVAVLLTGRLFCGYVCPIGTLQEWLYMAVNRGRKRFVQRIPYAAHRWLKRFKYVVLLSVAALAFWGAHRFYMGFCPVLALAHPTGMEIASVATLVVIIGAGLFVERFWCRYLCPYAALMNLFMHLGNWTRLPRLHISRNIEASLGCKDCLNYCPMAIDIGDKEKITCVECIQCGICVRRCTKSKEGKKRCLYPD